MTGSKRARFLVLFLLGAFVVVGTGMAYRAFIDRWKGDVRGPLIAAATVGIAYFVSTLLTLTWADRRADWKRRGPRN